MSHLSLQCSESPSDSQVLEDSPTIGRAVVNYPSADTNPAPSLSLQFSNTKQRKPPAPSPLQTSTAVSPPSSASPSQSKFPDSIHESPSAASLSEILARDPLRRSPVDERAKNLYLPGSNNRNEDNSPVSPTSSNYGFVLSADAYNTFLRSSSILAPRSRDIHQSNKIACAYRARPLPSPSNDTRSASDLSATTKPLVGSAGASLPNMAGNSISSNPDIPSGPPRTSSIDSAISAISSRTHSHQGSQDAQSGTADISNLVKAAGSPEAVIQYLLKEKQSQSQQNAQLWRLVDKQRAMILGLNKDLERSLKDKEKYRKKLKDVMAAHDEHLKLDLMQSSRPSIPQVNVNVPKEQETDVPASPSNLDSDSVKHSPIDVSLAPYPITPPADQVSNSLPSAVGELLDPSHAMPKASEHALDHFDHEQEDRAAEEAKKAIEASRDLPINIGLPPSRSFPSEPPRIPPPKRPADPPAVSVIEATPMIDQGISQFPPPSAPPPRKPPPAPLQLKKESKVLASISPEDEEDSDSDYDSLLEVDELPIPEKRGRRRTREEDDREREILAQKEAEARSLSKKSKKGSQKGTPTVKESGPPQNNVPASPRMAGIQPMLAPDSMPASLAGVLSGNETRQIMVPPLKSPGLPASPRPMPLKSPMNSPPMSPRSIGMAIPLSPRAPRQPIPMPHNAMMSSPPAAETSAKQRSPAKQATETAQPSSTSRESPVERTKIYRGFVTDEYPDLLLPPNALPSIEVKVASSRMKPSRASLISFTQLEEDPVFTLAVFSRSEGVELWRVEKDTASLAKLDQKMKQCASFTAKTPDRSLFSGHSPAKLDARRTILDQYLDELLNTPLDTATALELCRYLSTNTLRPNDDDSSSTNESNSESNAQKKGPGGRPFKNGYLTKRGKNFGGWKARFFVLDGPHLKYYEAPGGAHLGTIKLQNAQIGKQSQQTNDGSPAGGPNGDELDNQYRHAFLVLEPKKKDSSSHVKHVLCAESDSERDQWVDALLRWIDYKDGNDEEVHSAGHDRNQAGSNNTHPSNANSKKRGHGHGKQGQRGGSQDGLIGMSYDAAKQGNIPDGAPRHHKTGTPEPQDKGHGPTYTISAPKDPQLIPDSASWGTKMGLAPPGPTTEEKKQRKRSFFGFGSKNRPSGDDQDPLYGSNSGSAPPGQTEPRGPIRQVFGAPLAEAVRFNGPFDVSVPLPAVVYRCIQYLDTKNAIREEGIFRLSGSNVVIKHLRERFNIEGDVNLLTDENYYDIHAVASLLKLYLREFPVTILTRDLHMKFVEVTEMPNHSEKIGCLAELVQQLPLANETLLKYLIAFLIKIINHADMNKMTVRNVGIVFSPTLNIPAPVFALLLQNYEGIFGIDPEEYELPSPDLETDSRASESRQRRPSTATGSPQRQRLQEQVQQRSTPTPPPVVTGGLRPTATPPPRQTSYEPHYLAQPGSQSSLRPAYESGFGAPPGYESGPKQAGYDRPHYASSYEQDYSENSLSAYDPSYNKNKRRESSMFMGNMMLNQQGSRSRLREETRM